jgi:hypothetical protein
MFVIREVLHCKPGKVRPMMEKFTQLSAAVQDLGLPPLRLLTDVSGAPFWTLVAEATVDRIEDFFAAERQLMANENIRRAMADYHELVENGRREIYRLEG